MRNLVLLRGVMGAGKSTFVKENNLEQFTLSADDIRLLFRSPDMNKDGLMEINGKNDGKVWKLIHELLEERMKRGEFTIIDATHAKQETITQYKKLATDYRYRVFVLDFSDVSLEKILIQNNGRKQHKVVPENVILNSYERMKTEHVPRWVKVIKPDQFFDEIQYKIMELDEKFYKKVHHFGDVHGSFDVLMEYFKTTNHEFIGDHPILKNDELYIFVGDLLDRGTQNKETLLFFLSIYNLKNVVILEGNHEYHLKCWSNDDEIVSKDFIKNTQPYLEQDEDEESLELLKKETRQLYRSIRQVFYYRFKGKQVVVTHGGISKLPDNLTFLATEQLIKGVGDYEIDIDEAWDKNLDIIDNYRYVIGTGSFKTLKKALEHRFQTKEIYQIHGHRNIFRLPTKASKYSFNLEGQVEFGGHLRVVTLDENGFEFIETKNNNYSIKKGTVPSVVNEEHIDINQFIQFLSNHDYIQEVPLGDNLYSYNFTHEAFRNKKWDDVNVKARGLFINKNTQEIVARSYNKFFNLGERSFTKMNALADNLVFPVSIYSKPNGYLGILGYNSEKDELMFNSKSTNKGDFAYWFKELFLDKFGDKIEEIKNYVKEENVSLIFEVIKVKEDPHIIKYEEDKLILLDIVHRDLQYSKKDYENVKHFGQILGMEVKKLEHTFYNWTDFYYWYRNVKDNYELKEEGYVIEDSAGFMTKIKLPYYNFWKQFRDIKFKFAKKHEHTIKGGSMYTTLHNKVFKWMKEQNPEWLRETDIITIREKFEMDQKS